MAYDPKNFLADMFKLAGSGNIRSTGLDPLPSPPAESLAAALLGLPPPVIRDRWFKDQTIRIDGYTFERCRFDRCNLVTEMATFTFKECFISADCGLYLVGPALKVARLLMHTLHVKGRITEVVGEEALYAPVNSDGTFSLQ